jgi:hypothetical protein
VGQPGARNNRRRKISLPGLNHISTQGFCSVNKVYDVEINETGHEQRKETNTRP